jgi:Large polyvalent protein-associated domain 7
VDQSTDTLLGQFREAVYHRYKFDRSQHLPPAEGAELRATRFAAWLAQSQGAALDSEFVRHWAVADLMAHQEAGMPPVDEPSQRRVVEAMRANAQRQSTYALTLRTLMPDLEIGNTGDAYGPDTSEGAPASPAAQVEAAPQDNAREGAAKEERERAESEFLRVEIDRRPDPVGAADAPAVVEAARADADAVRRIVTIEDRKRALEVMGWRAYVHDGYDEALHKIAPDVATVAVALQSRSQDAAYKLPRDPAEDALLDAAVRGLDAAAAPAVAGITVNDLPVRDTAMAAAVAPVAAPADAAPAVEQEDVPVELQDRALRRRVERGRDWNLQEERNAVSRFYAAQDVESDLAAVRGIADFQQRALTLQAMAASAAHQVAYRDELLRQDPAAAAEAVRHVDVDVERSRAADPLPGLQRSELTIDGYLETLPADTGERPVFVTWLNGFVIPSHLTLGSFPDSHLHAASALARSRGLLLADDAPDSHARRFDVQGETLRGAAVAGEALQSSSPAPSPSPEPGPSKAASAGEAGPSAPVDAADSLTQELVQLASIRDRHAAITGSGKTIAMLTGDELEPLAQADAQALRQIRRADLLIETAAELREGLENPRYREALAKADFQVAKAMETLRFEAVLQAQQEQARASRPRGQQGVLVEVGEAPYLFKDGQPKTFYAKYLEDAGREGVAWGRHLPAALRAAEADIGDRIWLTRKPTPPELREGSEGLLVCDLAEFAAEVREKAQLPEDAPGATAPPGEWPTYRFRITGSAASQQGPTRADVVLCENVAALAASLDLQRGRSVHVEDFRLGRLWQLEVDASGAIRSTAAGSAFNIAHLSDADAAPAIEHNAPAAAQHVPSTQEEIARRLLQRVATVRGQDAQWARRALGLSSPQTLPSEASTSSSVATSVDTGGAAEVPPTASSQRLSGSAAANAPGGQQAAAAKPRTASPPSPLSAAPPLPSPLPPADMGADGFTGDAADLPTPSETICKLLESITYQMQRNGSVLYLVRDRPAFIDHGQQILMHKAANEDDQAVLAAVLLAKEKWGGKFELTGSEAFKRRALAVMLKYDVDVQLKNPQQEALRRELMQSNSRADIAQDNGSPIPLLGTPAPHRAGDARPDALPSRPTPPAAHTAAVAAVPAAPQTVPTPSVAAAPTAAELAPIHARDWWAVQREAIRYWSPNNMERDIEMQRLGPEPPESRMYWFDKAGRRCEPPADAEAFVARFTAAKANSKELDMAAKQGTPQEAPQVVLRGVKKVGEKFETTALLFKGKGDYLQGFITAQGQKHQVIVHMNERKPDPGTGELRPNFLRISEAQGDAKSPQWREIGYGNAVNHRADGKPVYFDEVLFNIGNDVVKARATASVDPELHRRLGFMEVRTSRPAANDSADRAAGASFPKPAPAAEVQEAAAGATPPKKSRHSSRARAAA